MRTSQIKYIYAQLRAQAAFEMGRTELYELCPPMRSSVIEMDIYQSGGEYVYIYRHTCIYEQMHYMACMSKR